MSVLAQATARGDVLLRRGVTDTFGVRWERSADNATFAPVDLSEWRGVLQLRSLGGEIWLEKPVLCDTSGLSVATITPEDTSDNVWASRTGGAWLINLTSPTGHVERVGDGYFYLEA